MCHLLEKSLQLFLKLIFKIRSVENLRNNNQQ